MAKKSSTDGILAWATVALAVATTGMALATFWLVSESREASFRQIRVQTWLELEKRFDSKEMKLARKTLARQLMAYDSSKHDTISETVLDFFDDAGSLYREGYLDKKLAESAFSFYACRWWEASKSYVDEEQKRHKDDPTLFEDFKKLAELMRQTGEKIDDAELKRFLEDESRLNVE